jgi:hypothetical protein
MKVIVTESQLRNLIKRQRKHRKDVEEAASLTSPSTSNQSASSPTSTTSSGSEANGTSPGADDYPAYPEVDHAEDLVTRGVANPVDDTKKHEDYPEANPVRGRANPIKGM